jgi:hypothetical protein
MKEAANVLTNDVVSKTSNKGLAHKKVRHRSVLDYMGECNLKGRRTEKNDRSNYRSKKENERSTERSENDRSNDRSKGENERSIERLKNDRSNNRSDNRSKERNDRSNDRSNNRSNRSNDCSKGGNEKNGTKRMSK